MTAATAGEVSVVVPTFNRAELLDLTLRTLERQTSPPAEIVVVDDGSTDATADLLAGRDVTVIRNPDGGWGPARARNVGLERVSTEYVAFVDSDDLLMPSALERLRDALAAARNAPFSYGRAIAVVRRGDGTWVHEGVIATTARELRQPLQSLFVRNSVPQSGTVARTETVRRLGGYNEELVWSEDYEFWIRLARAAPPAHAPELVCAYRRHSGNRYSDLDLLDDANTAIVLAARDERLRTYLPERLGVLAFEAALHGLHGRGLPDLVIAARLLTKHVRVDRVLAHAITYARQRRASARLGDEVWRSRPDLRDWLAEY